MFLRWFHRSNATATEKGLNSLKFFDKAYKKSFLYKPCAGLFKIDIVRQHKVLALWCYIRLSLYSLRQTGFQPLQKQ